MPAELNSFVGREQELIDLEHLLGTTRLLTLVVTGGSARRDLRSSSRRRCSTAIWMALAGLSSHLREPPG
jgi:hypothetical protein